MALDERKRVFKKNEDGEMVKLGEELDQVSGGAVFFSDDHPDGHEISCLMYFHWSNECDESPEEGKYHYFVDKVVQDINSHPMDVEECKYCGAWFQM